MDNSLLSLMDNSEKSSNNKEEKKNEILNYIIGIIINILLLVNYNNININLIIFIILYSIISIYLILKKKILDGEQNNILIFILILTQLYDFLNVFENDKTSIKFIFININLIIIKIITIYNFI